MFRQSPTNRNHRSKGIKTKHILQICLLLAVCFWLIYQVKRSYEKRKEFDENEMRFTIRKGGGYEIKPWGRKGLLPNSEELTVTDRNPEEDEENKPEEEDEEAEQDQENKLEEDSEGRGSGDDAVDEHDQEKSDEEAEQEDELVDDETDETKNSEESNGHELDEDSRSTHEAQEELYKADDASSAVTHGTNENAEEHENNLNLREISSGQNITELKLDNLETDQSNSSLNTTTHEEIIPENDSKNTSFVSLASVVESNSHPEGNNTTEESRETRDVPVQNVTQSSSDSNDDASNSTSVNPTFGSTNARSVSENATGGNHTLDVAGDKSDSSKVDTSNDVETEISETADETGATDETGQDLIDPSDTTIPLEEKELGTDLETLPEIQTEGSNTEDTAAE